MVWHILNSYLQEILRFFFFNYLIQEIDLNELLWMYTKKMGVIMKNNYNHNLLQPTDEQNTVHTIIIIAE